MKYARVAVSREWLLRLLKAIDGQQTKHFIPEDAGIADAEYDPAQRLFILTVFSDSLKSRPTSDTALIETIAVYAD